MESQNVSQTFVDAVQATSWSWPYGFKGNFAHRWLAFACFAYVWIYYSTIDKKLNTHKKLLVSRIGREKDANNDESLAVHDKKNLYLWEDAVQFASIIIINWSTKLNSCDYHWSKTQQWFVHVENHHKIPFWMCIVSLWTL